MKTALIISMFLSITSLFACNAQNADNPSNSAPSPDGDTPAGVPVQSAGPAKPDTLNISDSMPDK
jgi:hypothetical protein